MTTIRLFTMVVILMLVAACSAASYTSTIRADVMCFVADEVCVRTVEAVTRLVVNKDGYARDETDLDALTGELQRVVVDTLQPEKVSLWLQPTEKPRRNSYGE
ncbi:MAG: hypothetical protein DWI57_01715 [Chloroflexi bacterium]|nr:MAG: hypothetical protein DWI57_01715 [Chloroflexota bacterium]